MSREASAMALERYAALGGSSEAAAQAAIVHCLLEKEAERKMKQAKVL
jgi:regulator of protease activity HflC (stomatin/prohibitin superfamily)